MAHIPRVAALVGRSGSGKTTLVTELIRRFCAAGRSVGAIKHTHHSLNYEDRGDTAKFRAAGANPVILAGTGEAVVFADKPRRVTFEEPADLLTLLPVDIVLIEGFKTYQGWPVIEVDRTITVDDAVRILDRIWHP